MIVSTLVFRLVCDDCFNTGVSFGLRCLTRVVNCLQSGKTSAAPVKTKQAKPRSFTDWDK